MKKLLLFLPLWMLLCSGCGLWAAHPPLEAIETAETVGLDAAQGVRVSVTTGDDADSERIDETAQTLPLALEALRERSLHGGLFFGHAQFVLLGEDYARAGIQPLLDYAARSAELRLATPLFILRGTAADAVLAEEGAVTAQLTALSRSGSPACTVLAASDRLARTGCVLISTVRYDAEAHALSPDGCAVLRGGRLIGYLDADAAQAAAWLSGDDRARIALNSGATLAVKRCTATLDASQDGAAPAALTLTVRAEAEVEQLPESIRVTDPDVRARLETALAETIAECFADAIRKTQALRADALDLGGMLAARHPILWRTCAARWASIFPDVPVTVHTEVRITGTQDLTDPLPEEGGT